MSNERAFTFFRRAENGRAMYLTRKGASLSEALQKAQEWYVFAAVDWRPAAWMEGDIPGDCQKACAESEAAGRLLELVDGKYVARGVPTKEAEPEQNAAAALMDWLGKHMPTTLRHVRSIPTQTEFRQFMLGLTDVEADWADSHNDVCERYLDALQKKWVKAEDKPAAHDSDCAQHNAPALPVGPCDCSASEKQRAPLAYREEEKRAAIFDPFPGWKVYSDAASSGFDDKPAHAHSSPLQTLANTSDPLHGSAALLKV